MLMDGEIFRNKNEENLVLTSRNALKDPRKLNPIGNNISISNLSFTENIKSFVTPKIARVDLSLPVTKRSKKYDPSKHYFEVENLSTIMKKIKEAPEHMRDYKNHLETKMFKK